MYFSFVAILRADYVDHFFVDFILLRVHQSDVFTKTAIVGMVDFNRVISAKIPKDNL